MEQQLEAKEEGNLEIRETFSSLKEEVDSKTKKLNKVSREQSVLQLVTCDKREHLPLPLAPPSTPYLPTTLSPLPLTYSAGVQVKSSSG